MEAVAAIAVAGNALQFFDVAIKVVRLSGEVLGSKGKLLSYQRNLQEQTQAFEQHSARIEGLASSIPELEQVRQECQATADEIKDVLRDVLAQTEGSNAFLRRLLSHKTTKQRLTALLEKLKRGEDHLMTHVLLESAVVSKLLKEALVKNALSDSERATDVTNLVKTVNDGLSNAALKSHQFQIGLSAAVQAIRDAQIAQQDEVERRQLLVSLSFPEMLARRRQLGEGHVSTLDWAFVDDPRPVLEPEEKDRYLERRRYEEAICAWEHKRKHKLWLQQRSADMFWVHGKPGSGKSTLLARLAASPGRLQDMINEEWRRSGLRVASYFVWKPGTELQHSISGLLRSLNHQILSQDQDVLDGVLKKQGSSSTRLWLDSELVQTFDAVVRSSSVPIVIILDGLDELEAAEGTLHDFLRQLEQWSRLDNVRMLLSCRSEAPFTAYYEKYPSVRQQDLSRADLAAYVAARLEPLQLKLDSAPAQDWLPYFQRLILDRAEGVFLWVELVLNSLIRGATHHDSRALLEKRLEAMPGDVRGMYDRMWSRNEAIYAETASFLLQLALFKRSWPRRLGDLTDAGDYLRAMTVDEACAYFTAANEFNFDPSKTLELQQQSILAEYRAHVSSRCCGFLEVISVNIFEQGVHFIHRSAQEYVSDALAVKPPEKLLKEADLARMFAKGIINFNNLCVNAPPNARLIYWAASSDAAQEMETALACPAVDMPSSPPSTSSQFDIDRQFERVGFERRNLSEIICLWPQSQLVMYAVVETQTLSRSPDLILMMVALQHGVSALVKLALERYSEADCHLLFTIWFDLNGYRDEEKVTERIISGKNRVRDTLLDMPFSLQAVHPYRTRHSRQGSCSAKTPSRRQLTRHWFPSYYPEWTCDDERTLESIGRPACCKPRSLLFQFLATAMAERILGYVMRNSSGGSNYVPSIFGHVYQKLLATGADIGYRDELEMRIPLMADSRSLNMWYVPTHEGQYFVGLNVFVKPVLALFFADDLLPASWKAVVELTKSIKLVHMFCQDPQDMNLLMSTRRRRRRPRLVYFDPELATLLVMEMCQIARVRQVLDAMPRPKPESRYKYNCNISDDVLIQELSRDKDASFYFQHVQPFTRKLSNWDILRAWLHHSRYVQDLPSSETWRTEHNVPPYEQWCTVRKLIYDREAARGFIRSLPGFEEYDPLTWYHFEDTPLKGPPWPDDSESEVSADEDPPEDQDNGFD